MEAHSAIDYQNRWFFNGTVEVFLLHKWHKKKSKSISLAFQESAAFLDKNKHTATINPGDA